MEFRVPTNVQFIDDRLVPSNLMAASLLLPLETRVDHQTFRHERSAVAFVKRKVGILCADRVAETRVIPL